MLTDDDLTRELRAAFHGATADLRYTGRTRPPRSMTVIVPAATVAVTLVAVGVGIGTTDGHHRTDRRSAVGPAVKPSPSHKPVLVTKTMRLAGYALTYQTTAGAPPPVYAVLDVARLPDDVREVPVSGADAQVWVGKDPSNGNNALYVKAPTRDDGNLFGLESAVWTQDQLVDLFKHGSQVAVPAVSASDSGS